MNLPGELDHHYHNALQEVQYFGRAAVKRPQRTSLADIWSIGGAEWLSVFRIMALVHASAFIMMIMAMQSHPSLEYAVCLQDTGVWHDIHMAGLFNLARIMIICKQTIYTLYRAGQLQEMVLIQQCISRILQQAQSPNLKTASIEETDSERI